jgi:hypothetical protein
MQLSAAHCRAQQAVQLALAESEPLESRKKIALVAAAAWGAEAVEAENRESGKTVSNSQLDDDIAREFADEDAAGFNLDHGSK